MQNHLRHAKLYFEAGGSPTPKHHLCLHMFLSMATKGNPKYYHTYRDETLNGLIAKLCAAAHRFAFHTEVHRRFANLQQLRRDRPVPVSVAGCTLKINLYIYIYIYIFFWGRKQATQTEE